MTLTTPAAEIYWWEAAPPHDLARAPLPPEADVVVVGGGYAGLGAAITLARAGRSVVVLERDQFGIGASSRNGGMTSGNIRGGYDAVARRFGPVRGAAILREGRTAREDLYRFIADERIDCDLAITGDFDGALTLRQYDALARSAERLAKVIDVPMEAVPKARVSGFIGTDLYAGGVARRDYGGLHPAKFFAAMLKIAQGAGVQLQDHTACLRVTRDGAAQRVETSQGVIRAGRVIVCVNGHADASDRWLRRRLVPVRSRMIATEPLAPAVMDRLMPPRFMYGDTRNLSYYYRPSPDGTRILFGGRDGSTAGDPAAPTEHLRREMCRIFPELSETTITHSWFGHVAMNRDMIPRIFTHDGITYATGFCGSGVVWARWLGMKAAHLVLGNAEAAQSAFAGPPPAAVPFYDGRPWFIPAMVTWYRLRDRLAQR